MTEQRIIKKYPNRRLYDTAISSYITLTDVKELVLNCIEFRVIDARTEEDITHNTLLQIINEQEESGPPILTNQVLQQLIRNYGHSMQGAMSAFLEQSVEMMLSQQQEFSKRFSTMMEANPITMLSELTKQNLQAWQQLTQRFSADSRATTAATNNQREPKNTEKELEK